MYCEDIGVQTDSFHMSSAYAGYYSELYSYEYRGVSRQFRSNREIRRCIKLA